MEKCERPFSSSSQAGVGAPEQRLDVQLNAKTAQAPVTEPYGRSSRHFCGKCHDELPLPPFPKDVLVQLAFSNMTAVLGADAIVAGEERIRELIRLGESVDNGKGTLRVLDEGLSRRPRSPVMDLPTCALEAAHRGGERVPSDLNDMTEELGVSERSGESFSLNQMLPPFPTGPNGTSASLRVLRALDLGSCWRFLATSARLPVPCPSGRTSLSGISWAAFGEPFNQGVRKSEWGGERMQVQLLYAALDAWAPVKALRICIERIGRHQENNADRGASRITF